MVHLVQELVKIYGPSKRSTVTRWIAMAKAPMATSTSILAWLRQYPHLPQGFAISLFVIGQGSLPAKITKQRFVWSRHTTYSKPR